MNICSLIKFGEQLHMRNLHDKGTLYLNNLNVFRKIEDEELRGDRYETLYKQNEVNNVKISLGANRIGCAKKGLFQLWHEKSQGNIYSMYALKTPENLRDIKIDDRCKNFGDTCVFILDVEEFIKRVMNAANDAKLNLDYAPIEYSDIKSYQGTWSVFKKPLQYAYQNEFRFFVRREEALPLILNIGSLKDIAAIADSSKIDTLEARYIG